MMNNIIEYLDELIIDPKCELNYHKDYELLISVMLSAQTTDKRVNIVTKELFTKYNTLYENDNIAKNDFIAQKTFKGSCGKNINTMFPAFQCFIFKTLGYNPPEYSISD